jgi:Tfp pilus assembly protein PilV
MSVRVAGRRVMRRSRGFTLLDCVVVMLILSVGVPTSLVALRDAAMRRHEPIMMTRARWLLQSQLDLIHLDRADRNRGFAWVTNANYPAENPVAIDTAFSRTTTITETAHNGGAGVGLKTIVISVSWRDARTGQTRTATVSTQIADFTFP